MSNVDDFGAHQIGVATGVWTAACLNDTWRKKSDQQHSLAYWDILHQWVQDFFINPCNQQGMISGQIIATSHDVTKIMVVWWKMYKNCGFSMVFVPQKNHIQNHTPNHNFLQHIFQKWIMHKWKNLPKNYFGKIERKSYANVSKKGSKNHHSPNLPHTRLPPDPIHAGKAQENARRLHEMHGG